MQLLDGTAGLLGHGPRRLPRLRAPHGPGARRARRPRRSARAGRPGARRSSRSAASSTSSATSTARGRRAAASPAWTRSARSGRVAADFYRRKAAETRGGHPARRGRHLPGLLLRWHVARLRGLPAAGRGPGRRRWAGRTRSRTPSSLTRSRPRRCSRSASTTSCSRPSRAASRSGCTWLSAAASARPRRSGSRTSGPTTAWSRPPSWPSAARRRRPRCTRLRHRPTRSRSSTATSAAGTSSAAPRRRRDDHLSLVAGIASRTRTELVERGIATRRSPGRAAAARDPRCSTPARRLCCASGSRRASRSRARTSGRVLHELLEPGQDARGRAWIRPRACCAAGAQPGRPLPRPRGRPIRGRWTASTTCSGCWSRASVGADGQPLFHAIWSRDATGAVTEAAEQRAFERTIDLIIDRLERGPGPARLPLRVV